MSARRARGRLRRPAHAVSIALAAGALSGFCLTACRQTTAAAPARAPVPFAAVRPDVLLVTIDTLRADAVGFSGNARASTPLLDRLAASGSVFTDTHAHSVVTLPSHTNILTGLFPYQHGVRENSGFKLAGTVPTVATALHDAGYATAAFVAAFPLDSRFGLNRGFDVYDDSYPLGADPERFEMAERRGDVVVAAASKWWNDPSNANRPRFLWVHLYDPHAPYAPPEPFASRFPNEPYLGEVAAADSFLTPLLQPFLDGREKPAVVVITADHGEALGEHGEETHGIFAYEATLKVPLLLWGDGVPAGRDERAAGHVDIVPTILARLGLPRLPSLTGHSLLEPAVPGAAYFESLSTCLNRGWAPLRGALRSRWKFIELPIPELYDLSTDPHEAHNLFTNERRSAGELRALLPDEHPWPPAKGRTTSEESARLHNLGYINGSAPAKATYSEADDPKNLIDVDRLLQESIQAYGRGEYQRAAETSRRAIAKHADSEAYTSLAIALRQLERGDEAVAALREAMSKGYDTEQVRRALGLALSELGRPQEALDVLRPLAASDDAESVNAFAIALMDSGDLTGAEAALRAQSKATPRDAKTQENLAVAVLRAGRATEARDLLQDLLARNDRLPISWNTLGVARYQSGDRSGALTAWQRAVELDPRQFDALFNTALAALEAHQATTARRALERFIATAPPQRFAADIARARQLLAGTGK
ncbi:MAG: sulfatase-like hydrolase/transferase [Acidobacteriota bacterium]